MTLAALFECGEELGAVCVPPSALDLGKLGHELAAVHLTRHGLPLRVQPEAARALAVGRNPVIGDDIGHDFPFVQSLNVGLDLYAALTGCIKPSMDE